VMSNIPKTMRKSSLLFIVFTSQIYIDLMVPHLIDEWKDKKVPKLEIRIILYLSPE